MTRYRKIEVRTWSDEGFRGLSAMPPSGQGLWFYLLTGPQTGPIPGLYRAGRAQMAEELDWPLDDFYEKFGELEARGMAHADWKARLVWLPNAIKHNKPESPNVVRHWRVELDLLPECALKRRALAEIRAALARLCGAAYVAAFDEVTGAEPSADAIPEPSPKASAKASGKASTEACPNQEQEQEQEQQQEQDTPPPAPAQAPDAGGGVEVAGEVRAAHLSAAMKPRGINANPSHPDLIALAAQGTTPATVLAACDEAKRTKPVGPISMAYVIGILKRWQAEGDAIRLNGPARPPPRASPGQLGARDASRAAAAASIGLGGRHGRDDALIIDLN